MRKLDTESLHRKVINLHYLGKSKSPNKLTFPYSLQSSKYRPHLTSWLDVAKGNLTMPRPVCVFFVLLCVILGLGMCFRLHNDYDGDVNCLKVIFQQYLTVILINMLSIIVAVFIQWPPSLTTTTTTSFYIMFTVSTPNRNVEFVMPLFDQVIHNCLSEFSPWM